MSTPETASNEPVEIYVCNNTDCKSRGSDAVLAALRNEFADDADPAIAVHAYMCFSACNSGPNVVLPGRKCWLSSVAPGDTAVVREVIKGGEVPAHLREKNDPDLEELILGIIDAGLLAPEDD